MIIAASAIMSCSHTQSSDVQAVVYEPLAANNIQFLDREMGRASPPNEWLLCLRGEVHNDTLYVQHTELPFIHAAAPHAIIYTSCSQPDYVGTIHPHYSGNCRPSRIDEEMFLKDERALITAIACRGSIHTYTKGGRIDE